MDINKTSYTIAVRGKISECPVKFLIGKHNNGTVFVGILDRDDMISSDILYDAGVNQAERNTVMNAVENISDFFGIRKFLIFVQTGNGYVLPPMRQNTDSPVKVPAEVGNYAMLIYAHASFEGNSIFIKAVNTLFGLKQTDLFLGVGKKDFLCMFNIPAFKTSFMESRNMYMQMVIGAVPVFRLKGSFILSFLPEMEFFVDCSMETKAFTLEAYAHMERPISLFGPFSIGDTCLMIKFKTGFSFGMYTSLYIRELQLFGAVILTQQGSTITPDLLSAAVSDISIPILLDNLAGKHIEGIDALDFIKITGLSFQNMDPFDAEAVREKNLPCIVDEFNAKTDSSALKLNVEQVQMTAFGSGHDLTDLKRMRHYYIDKSGKIKLTAQFYYAKVNTTMGNYTVERGLFICGVVEIFKKRFEALFSYREKEGILAYAKIPSINLGFLKLGPSKAGQGDGTQLPISSNSVMSQFLDQKQDGIVFFLKAGDGDIFFYLDGNVQLLSLFEIDARILFCKGLISVDLKFVWLSILQVSLQLSVNYNSFTSGGFSFCLVIDTSKLTEKLTAVTKKIDEAIKKLQNKINNAKKELDRAQAHVNELYGQISNIDKKISQCRLAIKNAKWWKRAFVAIAQGIKIGAYEVAKAGIYAAIGVATAALKVAKKATELAGKIGESVMKAVNAVIKGAMSLFYINYIKLSAKANPDEQSFEAGIQFVALGKTYTFDKTFKMTAFKKAPTDVLSDNINSEMDEDVKNIEAGVSKTNWQRYQPENLTFQQQCRRLEEAHEYMRSSVAMMKSMQNTYVDGFSTPMKEFDEMNVDLDNALDSVENILDTGVQAGNVAALGNAMGGLKRSVAYREKKGVFRSEELDETKELISQYDEARIFYNQVVREADHVRRQRSILKRHSDKITEATRNKCGEVVVKGGGTNMADVLHKVETQLYEEFPVTRSGENFINLSRENCIREAFIEAEAEMGITPDQNIQKLRNRSRKGKYNSRL